jgi:aminoglycoside phosphotransferase (APT) family kinase protein
LNELDDFLTRSGLVAAQIGRQWTPLTGGISSDIWRVDLSDGRSLCVKRALPRLKVPVEWRAPVSRNAYEWAWMRFAAGVAPDAVPTPLACDERAGLLAMQFLPAHNHPLWKQQLLEGRVEPATAEAVGDMVGALHAASAHRADLARAFDTGESFHAIRLEPYLLATGRRHPALAPRLEALAKRTAATRIALVHGDVSPKNILVGPQGPVILDAECAWYGDPAFDIGFCLNHLLLKCLPRPREAPALRQAFNAFVAAYFARAAAFESRAALEARAAQLLPALLLARVDGKSPVEYVTEEGDRERVRAVAVPLIRSSPTRLAEIADCWHVQFQETSG